VTPRDGGPTVAALVLTYDAPENVLACVRAVAAQTVPVAFILVIENPGARRVRPDALRDRAPGAVRLVTLDENLGPAGGYAEGLRMLAESDCDAIWVLDDDVLPEPDCLAQLLARSATDAPAVVAPMATDAVTGVDASTWGWIGVLLPRALVVEIGVPNANLFYGFEDQDYLIDRAEGAGYTLVREPDAVVRLGRREGLHRPDWHSYYLPRNATFQHVYRRRHVARVSRWKRLIHFLLRWARTEIRVRERGWRRAGLFARGILDGLLGRLGRRVDPGASGRPRVVNDPYSSETER